MSIPTYSLEINSGIYSLKAVLSAAYAVSGLASTFVRELDRETGRIDLAFIPKARNTPEAIAQRFVDLLGECALREQLEKEYLPLRQVIYAAALADGDLLPESLDIEIVRPVP
jgi:His-Xaa-Ser system protein HxsD